MKVFVGNKNPPTEEYREARREGHRQNVSQVNQQLIQIYLDKEEQEKDNAESHSDNS